MKYGVSFLPDRDPGTCPASEYYDDAVRIGVHAELLGLEYVKMTEHYLNRYGGYCPDPLMFLTAVGARTHRIRLMTGCLIPALHHPVELAARTAMADVISGGRLDVGLARGYMPYEFAAFGVDMDTSRDRYEETIALLIELWRQPSVSHRGRFYELDGVTSLPRPRQQPNPPLWGAAVKSRQSYAWLGEQGFNLLVTPGFTAVDTARDMIDLYRTAHAERPDAAQQATVLASMPLVVRPRDQDAVDLAERLLASYLGTWADAAESWESVASPAYRGYTGMARGIRRVSAREFIERGGAVVGSPQHCVEQLERFRASHPVDGVLWQVDAGGAGAEDMRTSLDLFASEIRPALC